jgi:hypothetical protein
MPQNKHINSARYTLNLMIESLPEDSIIYEFILEQLKLPYQICANVKNYKFIPNKLVSCKSLSPFSFSNFKGGTYLFHQSIIK